MKKADLVKGKRILLVDDELDVLETLDELLSMCEVRKASTFEDAEQLLRDEYFDIAILDIMGVGGYTLLEKAKERKVLPVMLTAHALSTEDVKRSYEEGAALYVPKDKGEGNGPFSRCPGFYCIPEREEYCIQDRDK